MNFQKIKSRKFISVLLIIFTLAIVVTAQKKPKDNRSTIVFDEFNERPMPIAGANNLYCAGAVQKSSVNTKLKIVGADDEKDKHIFATGDYMYISSGAQDGVSVGDMFSVIRPRGKVKTKWTKKKNLGIYVQEAGAVEVIKVLPKVSIAKVKTSCSSILLGDLLKPIANRQSPLFKKRAPLDKFRTSSGKAKGYIFYARDGVELLAREQIVYIDLGREDNVSIGEYLTIYRKLGTGNLYSKDLKESVDNKEEGFRSRRYRGGTFSNQSARKKGENAQGRVVTTEDAKSDRPDNLRKVVGELIILNVFEKTATAMIVRNASEIHTGDRVEVQ